MSKASTIVRIMILASLITIIMTCNILAAGIPTGESLLASIRDEGPKPVLARLWADHEVFDQICSRIESGDPLWLKVASALRPAADAASAEELDFSVARALPNSPRGVLSMIGKGFDLEWVCTSPFIEESIDIEKAYLHKAEKALVKLNAIDVEETRKKCLLRIQDILKKLDKQ